MAEAVEIRPQLGPQEEFLASPADIVIYGGAAGGGKSFGLLLEPLRHVTNNPQFYAVVFRRTTVQVRNPGGLWDQSMKLYPLLGAQPVSQPLEWNFQGGGRVKFAHLEHETSVNEWQGSEIPLIEFDELTHFTEGQFWYLLSRNRSLSGVKPYIRATCNPDADSWVAKLIAWWIDQESGLPVVERCGVLRWFVRVEGQLYWADTPEELQEQFAHIEVFPKSLTFIAARLTDNQILMKQDPSYRASLEAMPKIDRERLLLGNWKARPGDGLHFQRDWFDPRYTLLPKSLIYVGTSDYAVTEDAGDWTELAIWAIDHEHRVYAVDWWSGQTDSSVWIEQQIRLTKKWPLAMWIGESGVIQKATEPYMRKEMIKRQAIARLEWLPSITDKVARSRSFQGMAALKNVLFPATDWADGVIDQLVGFSSEAVVDDKVDACSLLGRGLLQFGRAILPEAPPLEKPKPALGSVPAYLLEQQEEHRSRYRS